MAAIISRTELRDRTLTRVLSFYAKITTPIMTNKLFLGG